MGRVPECREFLPADLAATWSTERPCLMHDFDFDFISSTFDIASPLNHSYANTCCATNETQIQGACGKNRFSALFMQPPSPCTDLSELLNAYRTPQRQDTLWDPVYVLQVHFGCLLLDQPAWIITIDTQIQTFVMCELAFNYGRMYLHSIGPICSDLLGTALLPKGHQSVAMPRVDPSSIEVLSYLSHFLLSP